MKESTLVTALAEKSLNMAYFPWELFVNSCALMIYFISRVLYDHKTGEITRETDTPCISPYISQKTQAKKVFTENI